MENEKVTKEHLIETIRDIQRALDSILEDVQDDTKTDYWLMTLLCRIGELELCLNYNFRLKFSKGKEVKMIPNRLCECYEKLGGDYYDV